MPPRNAQIEIPALSRAFYGLTNQFATGEATAQMGSGKTGVQDTYVLDTSFDFYAIGRNAIWQPAASGGQIKAQMMVDRRPLVFGGASSGASSPGVGGGLCYLSNLFGGASGRYPQYYRRPLKIPGGSIFTVILDDRQTVAGAATVRVLHFGWADLRRVWAPRRWYAEDEPCEYVADFTAEGPNGAAMPASATQTLSIAVDTDFDFEITKVTISAEREAKIQVKNVAYRTEWFNKAVHVWLLQSTTLDADPSVGAWPFLLPQQTPEYVPAGNALSTTIQNLDTVNTNRVQVRYSGRKLKPPRGIRLA